MKAIYRNLLVALVFLMGAVSVYAQPSVRGKVTDEFGQPLPGVAVLVSGTSNGTMTDNDGNYSLSGLKTGDVLVFTSLGMGDQTFNCDGSLSRLNVTMKEDATFLEETIVVGYGTQKKSSMTSAVSAMKGDELMKAPSTNVSQLLAGKLPGISSVQESGEPGLDQAALRIRGSINSVSYVVDGFPVDNINDIDPADIESVSVLKDGASAAVYGLQASGGVIIITTKKGEKGKTKITYNASLGASLNANFPEFMDGPQFAYYYNVAQMMDQLASGAIASDKDYVPYFTKEQVEMMTNGDPTDGWDNVNYIDKVFGTGITQKHNITVQGGNDNMRYFASFGYLGQDGNIDNYDYERYNVRANIESNFAKYFHFNFGWSGLDNGYYLIPNIEFYWGQEVILNLKPDYDGTSQYTDNIVLTSLYYSNGAIAYNGITSTAKGYQPGTEFKCSIGGIANYGVGTFNGDIKLVVCNEDGVWKQELWGEAVSVDPGSYIYADVDCTITQTFEEGDRIRIYYKSQNSDSWEWLRKRSDEDVDEVIVVASAEDMADGLMFYYDKAEQKVGIVNSNAMHIEIYDTATESLAGRGDFSANENGTISLPKGEYRFEVSLGGEPYKLIVKL